MEIRDIITLLEAKQEKLELLKLPYNRNALSPVMSKDTLDYHFGKLAKGYVDRFNNHEGDDDFNEAGAFLHNLLFSQFQKPNGANTPSGKVSDLIDKKFGSFDTFKTDLTGAAMGIQGSGWVYLSKNGSIKTIANHAIKNDIVLLIDCWEHSYVLDYQADKAKYLKNIWKIINWNVCNERL